MYLYYVHTMFMTGLPIEVQKSKVAQMLRSQNYQNVKIRPPVPAKQQGSRSRTEIGHQTLPSSFRTSHKAHCFDGHGHFKDSAEDLKHHVLTSKLDHSVKATKRMDDSAIGSSETDSSYDDVDAQPLRIMSSGTAESYSSLSSYDVVSHLSDTELGSCNDCDSLRLPQTSKGYHPAAMKEVEELKNLVHQLSIKVEVLYIYTVFILILHMI